VVNEAGGIPLGADSMTRVPLQLDFFNVGPLNMLTTAEEIGAQIMATSANTVTLAQQLGAFGGVSGSGVETDDLDGNFCPFCPIECGMDTLNRSICPFGTRSHCQLAPPPML
jgi:hypothetical protein